MKTKLECVECGKKINKKYMLEELGTGRLFCSYSCLIKSTPIKLKQEVKNGKSKR